MQKYFFDYINIKICNAFVSLHSNLFLTMDNHCFELLKKIVSCYCSIRFKSHAREQNEILKKKQIANCFVQSNFTKWLIINICLTLFALLFFNESERQANYSIYKGILNNLIYALLGDETLLCFLAYILLLGLLFYSICMFFGGN